MHLLSNIVLFNLCGFEKRGRYRIPLNSGELLDLVRDLRKLTVLSLLEDLSKQDSQVVYFTLQVESAFVIRAPGAPDALETLM